VTRRPGAQLRVLQVCPRFPPDLGGVETHVAEVCRRLAAADDLELGVLATDRTGRLPGRDVTPEGVPVRRVRAYPRTRDFYVAPGLGRTLRSGRWDLVHVQGIHTAVPPVAMAAARAAGIPYVVTFHTGGHTSGLRNQLRGVQWKALTPMLRHARRLIAVGRYEQRLFERTTGLDATRFTVIRNGGGLPPLPTGVERVPGRILSCGRLEWYKGHHRAVEALAVLRRSMPEAHLRILGAGPIEGDLRALAARLGVADAVTITFVPPEDRADMARELAGAAVLLALSDYEAHPVAVMEALALGLPVVGADVAGIGDLVEDGAVRGVPVGASAGTVARTVADVLTQPGPASPPDLPTWEQAAERLHGLYRDVLVADARLGSVS